MIPNDNLMYRSTVQRNGVNVQDANLLKIRVTYLYETKMPLTRYFFTPLMNANLTGVLFGGQSAGTTLDAGWRIPLVSYATVRMQSDFKGISLPAGSSGGPIGPGKSHLAQALGHAAVRQGLPLLCQPGLLSERRTGHGSL